MSDVYPFWQGIVSGAVIAAAALVGTLASGALPAARRGLVMVSMVVMGVVFGMGLWAIHYVA